MIHVAPMSRDMRFPTMCESMNIMLLTEHRLEFLSLKGGYTGSSESTLVKMPHCGKSHVADHLLYLKTNIRVKSGNFGHQANLDIHLQTVGIMMRRLLMSRLIRIFSVCLVNLLFHSNK